MFLGIDIGTSSVKAVLVDESGEIAGQAQAPLSISRPRPGWSEQDPADWWQATGLAVTALDAPGRRAVRGIGLSGQMHGATLLDASDTPLRPAILWNDGRSEVECRELEADEPQSRRITGNLAMPGFTAPKLLWVRKHEPDVFARVRTVLLPKDYVRLRMTGDKASDLSDAAGTLWVDVAARRWSLPMLAATGLAEVHMPRLHEGPEPTGRLRAEVAEAWGMGRVPVVAGGGDNAAGAVGVGVIEPGDAFLSLGTSGVLFVAGATFLPESWAGRARVLSRAAWSLAPDDGDAVGRQLCRLGGRGSPARRIRPHCWRGSRRADASTARRSSCPTCRASARRTTTRRRAACCSA